ncbi:MAG: TIGR03619 family F420-dependent LLM class oxidoreductase [Acidimicrobiia bacterium]|nr:TIGR03619 family F420-dependent LLM class oxidoreductase [Acidimicrobiia bacterium]
MTHATVSVVPEGVLAYGMQLPVQALSLLTSSPWERVGAGPDEMLAAAQAADDAGFFYVAVCDHIAIPREKAESMSTTWFHPVATLAWIAGQTRTVRLMTNVFVPAYRHPLETAKAFATLDRLSNGRVILGVGAGHVEGEFDVLGVPFAERGRLTDEAVDGIVESWLSEFVGDVGLSPRPVQQPRPPVWIGGSSKPALRRVAARGDGWIPQGTPRKLMPGSIAYLHAQRDELRPGASFDIGMITELVHVGEPTWDLPKYTLSGAPEPIIESLNEYGTMGVSHLQLRFAARSIDELCDQMARFGAEVGPHLSR